MTSLDLFTAYFCGTVLAIDVTAIVLLVLVVLLLQFEARVQAARLPRAWTVRR